MHHAGVHLGHAPDVPWNTSGLNLWWQGGPLAPPTPLVYTSLGDIYLVSWDPTTATSTVRHLEPDMLREQLALAGDVLRDPMGLARALLDHSVTSYVQELEAAALAAERREQGQRAQHGHGVPT